MLPSDATYSTNEPKVLLKQMEDAQMFDIWAIISQLLMVVKHVTLLPGFHYDTTKVYLWHFTMQDKEFALLQIFLDQNIYIVLENMTNYWNVGLP